MITNLETLRWLPARIVFTTVGRASEGIRTGLRYGFSSGEMLDYVYGIFTITLARKPARVALGR